MQGSHTHIPRTNHVPRGYIVAAILSLLFMVPLCLVPALAVLFFYVSTFRSMCAVPNMAVFCSSLTSWLLLLLLLCQEWSVGTWTALYFGFSDDDAAMLKYVQILYFVCFLVVLCEFVWYYYYLVTVCWVQRLRCFCNPSRDDWKTFTSRNVALFVEYEKLA